MEDEKKELEILKEVINHLKLAYDRMSCCDNVKTFEFDILGLYLQELDNRRINLEIEINGCILEEV